MGIIEIVTGLFFVSVPALLIADAFDKGDSKAE